MVQEWNPETKPFSQGEVDYAEHSAFAKAKKVIDGPLNIPQHATLEREVPAIQVALNGAVTVNDTNGLKPKTAYRMISNIHFHYFQASASVAGPATLNDTYVPADTPVVIQTGQYGIVYAIPRTGTGILQFQEVR